MSSCACVMKSILMQGDNDVIPALAYCKIIKKSSRCDFLSILGRITILELASFIKDNLERQRFHIMLNNYATPDSSHPVIRRTP